MTDPAPEPAPPAGPIEPTEPTAAPAADPAASPARRGVSPVVWVAAAAALIAAGVLAWAFLSPVQDTGTFEVEFDQEELDRLGR